jgi:hypothetical protein
MSSHPAKIPRTDPRTSPFSPGDGLGPALVAAVGEANPHGAVMAVV